MNLIYKYLIGKAVCTLLFTIIALVPARAQQPFPFFTNYTTENGMSDNSVNCITRDRNGFLWVGTMGGLNRFNGYDFTIYKSIGTDSSTIPSNRINSLHSDKRGRLWVGTFNGVAVFNPRTNIFSRIDCRDDNGNNFYDFEVFTIYEDSQNRIFMTTNGKGLLVYREKDSTLVPFHDNEWIANEKTVNSITELQQGTYSLNTRNKIFRFSQDPHYNIAHDLNSFNQEKRRITLVKLAPDQMNTNKVWVATWGKGLMHFDLNTGQYTTHLFEPGEPENLTNIITHIFQYNDSTLWLASNRGIIPFYTTNSTFGHLITDIYNSKSIIATYTKCLYKDPDDILWIGTDWGLCNINPAKQSFTRHQLWRHPKINKFYIDEASGKIYATRFYENRNLVIYDQRHGIQKEYPIPVLDAIHAEPFALMKDRAGTIWLGTTMGLRSFNESTGQFTYHDLKPYTGIENAKQYFTDIAIDSIGNPWFADYNNGLLYYDYSTHRFDTIFTIGNNTTAFKLHGIIRILLQNQQIYLLSETQGLIILDTASKKFIHYNSQSKRYNRLKGVSDMTIGRNQMVYVSTKNNGLLKINNEGEISSFIKDDVGTIIDEQNALVYFPDHYVWIASNKGLHRFDSQENRFTHYTVENGLPERNFNSTLSMMNDGSIAYLVYHGLYSFIPSEVTKKPTNMPLHLVSIMINGSDAPFNATANLQDTIKLHYSENYFTVEFAAINFTDPGNTLYSYMLDDGHNGWSVFSPTRTIQFSDVKPGRYKLRIRTEQNSNEKSVVIVIIPAWWQTRWFKYISIALILTAVYFTVRFILAQRYRRRIEALEKQEEIANIRMRISRDIHDEIGSGLTRIKLMSLNLLRQVQKNTPTGEITEKITDESDELMRNLGEIVWTINPANDTLENILAFIRSYTARLFNNYPQIKLTLQFPEPESIPQGVIINPDIKRNLLMIHKEALNNVIRHSGATQVTVAVKADSSCIEMSISDNGKGLEENKETGNGIINMRKRSEFINATFEIESSATTGTMIRILVPLV